MVKVVDAFVHNEWPRERHLTHNSEPSMARQEFAAECDINTLMEQYEKHAGTGPGLLQGDKVNMFYADFTQLPGSLMEYHQFMDDAQAAFMKLPAAVRKEFDNSPHMFVEFASDPENLPQMRTWGLAAPEAPKAPPAAPPGPAPAAAAAAPPAAPVAAGGATTHGST